MKSFEQMKMRLLKLEFVLFACSLLLVTGRQQESTQEMTRQLQKALKNYDKRILPSEDGRPTDVKVQVYIVDMVPLKRYHMHFSMDIFFRQIWKDYRLSIPFNGSKYMALASETLDSIWIPEVHFASAKKGRTHDIMKPNVAIHLHKEGVVFISRRVSLTLFCPMDLHNFPFDEQICKVPLKLRAYDSDHCKLSWDLIDDGPIYTSKNMHVSEYMLKNWTYGNTTFSYTKEKSDKWDVLWIRMVLKREVNFYVLQYMTPCALIVVLSWVGFWIKHTSIPARASLGITTILTVTSFNNSIRALLPNVAYTKSIDVYLLVCFVFVFASTVEFAIVGVADLKWTKALKKKQLRQQKEKQRQLSRRRVGNGNHNLGHMNPGIELKEVVPELQPDSIVAAEEADSEISLTTQRQYLERDYGDNENTLTNRRKRCSKGFNHHGSSNKQTAKSGRWERFKDRILENHARNPHEHIIDKRCRVIFPVLFLIFNIGFFVCNRLIPDEHRNK